MKTKDIKKALRNKLKKRKLTHKDFLSTGSTLLNLALTGYPYRGFIKGKYHFIVGDSSSGKTFLSLTCLAEAAKNPNFDNHRFIYDNAEDGALMDIKKFFGEKVFERMEWPSLKNGMSSTIEEFYYHVDDAIKTGKPFIYILDSMDSLSSKQEAEKFDKTKKEYRAGKESTGIMTDGKAKSNSANLRAVISYLKKERQSILIIINQTRDTIGLGFGKSRSGGHALKFYATTEFWSSVLKRIKKKVAGKDRQLGVLCKLNVRKNRIDGKERVVEIPIYTSFGIDDIGSCVDYLISEGHWKKKPKGKQIKAKGLGIKGSREKIIRRIENEGWEKDLREIVTDVWNKIEEACTVKRKKRYV